MPDDIHPGSFVGDTVEEFKKLPTWGKVAVGVGVLVVLYIAYEVYANSKSSGPSQATSLSPTTNPSGSQSPFPQVQSGDSSVPLLPSGVSPLYNSQGGLTGFQQSAPTSAPAPTTVGATPNPPTPTGMFASIRARFSGGTSQYDQNTPGGIPIRATPGGKQIGLEPYGANAQISGPVSQGSSNLPGIASGSNQWYQLKSGGYVSSYDVTGVNSAPTVQPPSGGGAMSIQSRMHRRRIYTLQTGDNVWEIMRKMGYHWPDIHALNGYPTSLQHGDRLKLT